MKKFNFSQNSIKYIQTVNPVLQELAARAIEVSEVDFGVLSNGGLRDAKMQNKLYKRGSSKLDGYIKKSYHQTGNAIDLVLYRNGFNWKDIDGYHSINKAVIKAWEDLPYKDKWKLEWGGDWSWKDYAHYQIIMK